MTSFVILSPSSSSVLSLLVLILTVVLTSISIFSPHQHQVVLASIISISCNQVYDNNWNNGGDSKIDLHLFKNNVVRSGADDPNNKTNWEYPNGPCSIIVNNSDIYAITMNSNTLLSKVVVLNSRVSHIRITGSFYYLTASENFIHIDNVSFNFREPGTSTLSPLLVTSSEITDYCAGGDYCTNYSEYVKYGPAVVPTIESRLKSITVTNCFFDIVASSTTVYPKQFIQFPQMFTEILEDIRIENISCGVPRNVLSEAEQIFHAEQEKTTTSSSSAAAVSRNEFLISSFLSKTETNRPMALLDGHFDKPFDRNNNNHQVLHGNIIFRNLLAVFSEPISSPQQGDHNFFRFAGIRSCRGDFLFENVTIIHYSGVNPRMLLLAELTAFEFIGGSIIFRHNTLIAGRKNHPSIRNSDESHAARGLVMKRIENVGGSFIVENNNITISGKFIIVAGFHIVALRNMLPFSSSTTSLFALPGAINRVSISHNTFICRATDPEYSILIRAITFGEASINDIYNITNTVIANNTINTYITRTRKGLIALPDIRNIILRNIAIVCDNIENIIDPSAISQSTVSTSFSTDEQRRNYVFSEFRGSGKLIVESNIIESKTYSSSTGIGSFVFGIAAEGAGKLTDINEFLIQNNNITILGWGNAPLPVRIGEHLTKGLEALNIRSNHFIVNNFKLTRNRVQEDPTIQLMKKIVKSLPLPLILDLQYCAMIELLVGGRNLRIENNRMEFVVDPRNLPGGDASSSSSLSTPKIPFPPPDLELSPISTIDAIALRDIGSPERLTSEPLKTVLIQQNSFLMVTKQTNVNRPPTTTATNTNDLSQLPLQDNTIVHFFTYGPSNPENRNRDFIEEIKISHNVFRASTSASGGFVWFLNLPTKIDDDADSTNGESSALQMRHNDIHLVIAPPSSTSAVSYDDSNEIPDLISFSVSVMKSPPDPLTNATADIVNIFPQVINRRRRQTNSMIENPGSKLKVIQFSNLENMFVSSTRKDFRLAMGGEKMFDSSTNVIRLISVEGQRFFSCSVFSLNFTVSVEFEDWIKQATQYSTANPDVAPLRHLSLKNFELLDSQLSNACRSMNLISLETPRRLTSVLTPPSSNSDNNQQQPTNIHIDVSDNQLSSSSGQAASSIVDFDHSVFSDADVHRSAANTQIQVNVVRNRITTRTSSGNSYTNTSSLASISELSGADSSFGSSSAPSQRTRLKLDFVENSLVVDDQQHLQSKPPPYSVLRRHTISTNNLGLSLFSSTTTTFPFLALNISRSNNEEKEGKGICNLVNGRDIEMRDAERDFDALFEDYSVSSSSSSTSSTSSVITATGCVTTRTLSVTFWNASGQKQRRRTTTPMPLLRPRPPAVVSPGVQTASNAMQGVSMVAAGISSAAAVPTVAFSVARQQAMFGFIRRLTDGNCAFDSSTLAERRVEDEEEEFETVDAAESPTQMALGDAALNPARHFVGAVVGNFVLSCCLVLGGQAAGTLFLWRSGSRSWRDPLSVFARCNVSLVVFVCASLLFAPTLTYGLVAAAMSGRTVPLGSKILAVVVSLLLFALPCSYYVVWALWLRRSRVAPPPKSRSHKKTSSEENTNRVRERYVRRHDVAQRRSASKEKAAGCMALLKRVYAYWLEGPGEWAMPSSSKPLSSSSSSSSRLRDDDRRDRMDFDIAVPVFDGFNLRAKWFAVAEFGVQALLALTAFIVQLLEDRGPEVNCVANLALLLVINGVYLVLCLWLRPFQELFLRIATPLLVALQMVVVIVTYLLKDRLVAASSDDNNNINNKNEDSNYVVTSEAMVVQIMLVVTMVMQTMMSLLVLVASVAPILRIVRRVLSRISRKAVDSVQSSSSNASPMMTRRQRSATLRDLILSQDEEVKRDQPLLAPTSSPPAMQHNNHHRLRSSSSHTTRPRSSSESHGPQDRGRHDFHHHHRHPSARRRDETVQNDHHRHRAQSRNRHSLPSSSPSSRNHHSSSHRHEHEDDTHRRRNSSSRQHHEASSSHQIRPSLSSTAATMNRPQGSSRNNKNNNAHTKSSSVSRSRPSRSKFPEL